MGYEMGRKYHKHFVSGPRNCKGGIKSLCVKEKYIKIAYLTPFNFRPPLIFGPFNFQPL